MSLAKNTLMWARPDLAATIFAKLPVNLRQNCRRRQVSAGTNLFAAGDTPRTMYCVITGEVRLLRPQSNGQVAILQRCRRGVLAEASLLQPSYHCAATVSSEADLLTIPRPALHKAMEDVAFRSVWLSMIASELRSLRAQVERLNLTSAEDRIRHFIDAEGHDGTIFLNGPAKVWASELGLTHEALYRALTRMVKSKSLQRDGGQLTLLGGDKRQKFIRMRP